MGEPGKKSNPKSLQQDAHSIWVNKVTTNLVQKVNPNIHIKQIKNGKELIFSNISESDLPNLQFLTHSDNNNNYGFVAGVSVSIDGNIGPIPLLIPGFSQIRTKIYNDSASQAFLSSHKIHTPFRNPFTKNNTSKNNTSDSLSVGDYIDMQTSVNPSLPKTVGKPKTYSIHHKCSNNMNTSMNDILPESCRTYNNGRTRSCTTVSITDYGKLITHVERCKIEVYGSPSVCTHSIRTYPAPKMPT